MTQMNGAEAMVRMLQLNGVKHIFGLCGDTSLPFYDALARLDHGMDHILTRDERSAAYMADGYARVTGKPGVCEGPSGGGATYLLPGLVEANESAIPLLGITSDVSVGSRGKFPLTELDQQALYAPLTKWNTRIDRVDQIPHAVRSAFRAMTTAVRARPTSRCPTTCRSSRSMRPRCGRSRDTTPTPLTGSRPTQPTWNAPRRSWWRRAHP